MGLAPSAAWTALPLHPLRLRDPSPTPAWAAPFRSIAKRVRGVGGQREREGGEGRAVIREGSSSRNGGDGGGDPPNGSWGQTHIWGLSKGLVFCLRFRQTSAQNWGKSVLFDQKARPILVFLFVPSLFPFCLKMAKICCFLPCKRAKKVGRKRGLCHFVAAHVGASMSALPRALQIRCFPCFQLSYRI